MKKVIFLLLLAIVSSGLMAQQRGQGQQRQNCALVSKTGTAYTDVNRNNVCDRYEQQKNKAGIWRGGQAGSGRAYRQGSGQAGNGCRRRS